MHYPGWDRKYDEWRKACDVVDIRKDFTSSNAHTLLKNSLVIRLKESLSGARLQDPEVNISIPVQLDTFTEFLENLKPLDTVKKGAKTTYRLSSFRQGNICLGRTDWWYRVLNGLGDSCYIVPGTFHFWLSERCPLTEFSLDGQLETQLYRGYVLVVRFVRDTKSKSDMVNVIKEHV